MSNTNPTSDETTDNKKPRILAITDVDADLRAALEKAAGLNRRSMAAEANFRLRETFGLNAPATAA